MAAPLCRQPKCISLGEEVLPTGRVTTAERVSRVLDWNDGHGNKVLAEHEPLVPQSPRGVLVSSTSDIDSLDMLIPFYSYTPDIVTPDVNTADVITPVAKIPDITTSDAYSLTVLISSYSSTSNAVVCVEPKEPENRPVSGPLITFTCFGKLPAELRIKIWGYMMLHPRILQLRFARKKWWKLLSKKMKLVPRGITPPVLQVCVESRLEAKKYYNDSDDGFDHWPIFNCDLDTFYIPFPTRFMNQNCYQRYSEFCDNIIAIGDGNASLMRNIQNIAVDYHTGAKALFAGGARNMDVTYKNFEKWIAGLPCHLPKLLNITVYWATHDMNLNIRVNNYSNPMTRPYCPRSWRRMFEPCSKPPNDVMAAADKMALDIQSKIALRDSLRKHHILTRSRPPSGWNICCRKSNDAPHSAVRVRFEHVDRIGDDARHVFDPETWRSTPLRISKYGKTVCDCYNRKKQL